MKGAAGEDTTSLDLTVSISDGVNPSDTGTISILIKDDSPQANPDADSLFSDSLVAETGNVITGAGTAGGLGGRALTWPAPTAARWSREWWRVPEPSRPASAWRPF